MRPVVKTSKEARRPLNWNLSDIPVFVAVIENNGITAASTHLAMPKSTVSRALQRLEDDLQVRLLERNSRHMRLTSEGDKFFQECQVIMEQVASTNAMMNGIAHRPSGPLYVSMPLGFSRHLVSPRIHRFYEQYPDIELHLLITPNPVDLIGDHIDLAVQVGALPDSELIAVPLNHSPLIWVASPDQFRPGHCFESIDELLATVVMCETRYNKQALNVQYQGVMQKLTLNASIETPDPIMVRDAVASGLGTSILPEIYCRDDINAGRLVRIAPDVEFEHRLSHSHAVYTSRRMLSLKTRLFIEFLRQVTAEAMSRL